MNLNSTREAPPRHGSESSFFQRYAAPRPSEETTSQIKGSVFSPFFLPFMLERIDSSYRHLHLLNVLAVCERWHEALCKHRNDLGSAAAEMITGCANGMPCKNRHLAFVPLALVGHSHGDGRLLGMGLALPEKITREERRGVSAVLERVCKEGLKLGRFGKWRIQAITARRPSENLLAKTWTHHPQGATDWATVTPIAFDRHAKAQENPAYRTEVGVMIRRACRRVGIPEPCEVIVTPVSAHFGAPPAKAFPRFRKDGSEHCHAILIFAEPVRGPILLGAGRYRGYGLCRPMLDEA